MHVVLGSAFEVAEICAICCCDIALLPKKDAKPVRHAGKVYCGECARLILDPDTDRGAEEIEVPDPDFDAIENVPDANLSASAVRRRAGIEVVEEFNIKVDAPQKERKLEDDDWFKQANAKPGVVGGAAVAVREKKGGASISRRSEPEKRSNSARIDSVKPSGRMAAIKPAVPAKPASVRNIPAAPKSRPEPEAELEPVEEPPARKSSRRMERASARSSGRMGNPSASSRMKVVPAKSAKPAEPEELEEVPAEAEADEFAPVEPEPKQSESKRGIVVGAPRNSSRRMKAANRGASTSVGGGAKSKSARNDKSERGEREERGRGKRGGDNMNMMLIGAGVVGVVLLVICVAAFGGSKKPEALKQGPPPAEIGQNSSELARHAADLEAKGDKQGAADYYTRAAEACSNNEQAQQYNMHAYQIRKFTVLPMHH